MIAKIDLKIRLLRKELSRKTCISFLGVSFVFRKKAIFRVFSPCLKTNRETECGWGLDFPQVQTKTLPKKRI